MPPAVTCFLHVAKTGGDSFRRLAYYNTPDEKFVDFLEPGRCAPDGLPITAESDLPSIEKLVQDLRSSKSSHVFLCSNLAYGLHERVGSTFDYVTFVRHPVSRARSYWKFVYRNRDVSPMWREWESLGFDIEAIVRSPSGISLVNDQTRLFDGRPLLDVTTSVAEQLIANAPEKFLFVGDFDQYEKHVLELCDLFGWSFRTVPRVNVATAESGASIPPGFDDTISSVNAADAQIYSWARSLSSPLLKADECPA